MTTTATLRVRFLGTGTSSGVPVIGCSCPVCRSQDPRDTRLRTSGLVTVEATGAAVLIDCGPDFRAQALRAGLAHLDGVLLTHAHQDHIGGLDELRAVNEAMHYSKDDDYESSPPLPLYGNAETLAEVRKRFSYIWDTNTQKGGGLPRLQLVEVVPFVPFVVAGIAITPLPVRHGKLAILGYALGVRGLAWITDASTLPPETHRVLCGDATRPHLLVVNALRRKEHPTHWTIARATELSQEVCPPAGTYFVHLTHNEFHANLEESLPPRVHVAFDGLELKAHPAALS